MDNANEELAKKQLHNLKKFNFGAFVFGWIWGFSNGVNNPSYVLLCLHVAIALISLLTFGVAIIFFLIPLFVMSLIFGFKGNQWAYDDKDWDSFEEFETAQRKWTNAGIIFFASIIIFVFALPFLSFAKIVNDIENKGLGNKMLINFILKDTALKETSNSTEIADRFLTRMNKTKSKTTGEYYNYKKYNSNSIYTLKEGGYISVIQFKKAKDCNLKAKNCSVSSYYYSPEKILLKGDRTYYDYSGKTLFEKIERKKNK